MPFVQVISRNVFLSCHEISNNLCQSLTVAISITLQVEDRKGGCTVKSKSCMDLR
jgi:hypothetical protein